MIFIKKFEVIDPKKSYVLMDFDHTITSHNSISSWGILEHSTAVDPRYSKESLDLYLKYRPIELDAKMPYEEKRAHMVAWQTQVGKLINKYHIYIASLSHILEKSKGFKLRKGVPNFLSQMHILGVPVIIVSAGIGDFIKIYLSNEGLMFDNITLHSNFLVSDESDLIVGFRQPIINSMNKEGIDYTSVIGNRNQGLLFGDLPSDKSMGHNLRTINVGFCDESINDLKHFQKEFDIVLTGGSSYDELGKVMIKNYKAK